MDRTMIVEMPGGSRVERPVESLERDERTGMMMEKVAAQCRRGGCLRRGQQSSSDNQEPGLSHDHRQHD